MWADSTEALEPLELESRTRVLDVGCGSGELTRVLTQECPGTVIGCDVDRALLEHARTASTAAERPLEVVRGDATRLPFADDSFDLVVCQALLINLPDPVTALTEFARVSSGLVAAVEPDNSAVTVESTIPRESVLEARARRAYLEGIETDVTLGADARSRFTEAGLEVVASERYDHGRTIGPPYGEYAMIDARRKATGAGLADDRATMLEGPLTGEEYDALRGQWRALGRDVIEQMQAGEYERTETVPFFVTVGSV